MACAGQSNCLLDCEFGALQVIDRLGQFDEVLTGVDTRNTTAAGALPENSTSSADGDAAAGVAVVMAAVAASRAMEQRISRGEPDAVGVLLQLDDVSLRIPNSEQELVRAPKDRSFSQLIKPSPSADMREAKPSAERDETSRSHFCAAGPPAVADCGSG